MEAREQFTNTVVPQVHLSLYSRTNIFFVWNLFEECFAFLI